MGFHSRCDTMIGYLQKRVVELEQELAETTARSDAEKRELLDRIINITDPNTLRMRAQRDTEKRIAETAAYEAERMANFPPGSTARAPRLAGTIVSPAQSPLASIRPRGSVASAVMGAHPGTPGPGGVRVPMQTAPSDLGDDVSPAVPEP
jgi:hypothetical protein